MSPTSYFFSTPHHGPTIAPPAGLEPASNRVEADCSNPLSYGGLPLDSKSTVVRFSREIPALVVVEGIDVSALGPATLVGIRSAV